MSELDTRLQALEIPSLGVSEYNQVMLEKKLACLPSQMGKYRHIINRALRQKSDATSLIEYGGGLGFLALVARDMGIKTVIYNDIYPESCRDAQIIAKALGLEADEYIEGDIDSVVGHRADIIVSYDVLEHIHNIGEFLTNQIYICNPRGIIMHCSGANLFNHWKQKQIRKMHVEVETMARERKRGHKDGMDSLEAFCVSRENIIRECSNHPESLIKELALATRGLAKDRIIQLATTIKGGDLIQLETDPTNTCDPYSGNWAERLMNPYKISWMLGSNFEVKILAGYNPTPLFSNPKSAAYNIMIRVLPPRLGLMIAPYYCLFGRLGSLWMN